MNPGRLVWLSRLALAGGVAVCLGWLPYQIYGRTGAKQLIKLHDEREQLRRENAALRTQNLRLRAVIALSDEDELAAIERVAREELGFVKTGEIVFRIEDGQ